MDTDPRDTPPPPGQAPLTAEPDAADTPPEARRTAAGTVVYGLATMAILAAGAGITAYYLRTGTKAQRRPADAQARLVDVTVVRLGRETVTIPAMGVVTPARTVDLQPRVTGEVVALGAECLPGGRFQAGEEIARIDAKDYALAIEAQEAEVARLAGLQAQRQSEVQERKAAAAQRAADLIQAANRIVEAETALQLEAGRQAVARREYELLGETVRPEDRELVLRQPQLRAAEAARAAARAAHEAAEAAKRAAEAMVASAEAAAEAAAGARQAAEAALRKARLDHERTTIRAPFNALVESKLVDPGSLVTPASRIARLVGTDAFWVEVSVPVDRLNRIRLPDGKGAPGAAVRVYNEAAWGPGVHREGRALRLAGALEPNGRMARLLVEVPDPLALAPGPPGRLPLLLGSYVRVEIDGGEIDGVAAIDRDLLRDGDRVWVLEDPGRLAIRPVTIVSRERDRLLVSEGLRDGDRVVTTNLAAPVAGMPLRVAGAAATAPRAPETLPPAGGGRGDNR